MGIKKRRISRWFRIRWKRFKKMHQKKVISKNVTESYGSYGSGSGSSSTTLGRRYCWHRWQVCHRCQQHKGNWWKNLPPVSLTPVVHLDYFREFSKKFEMILMLLSGAWGKVIHEKNLKQKISWHCLFNTPYKIQNVELKQCREASTYLIWNRHTVR